MSIYLLIFLWWFTIVVSICYLEGTQSERLWTWPLLFMLWASLTWCTKYDLEEKGIEFKCIIMEEQ